ncbi:YdeI/OmpD-associated family protein [Sphingomonas psychrotolerans]|uniref:YdeI/OmpD-associated family protein n=1 Tax=Sphingomonas psychrotolerans TaxID=1327635 RepID=A0ABU3N7S5_9SPHN|nr:YdeI/OmpD-associated family protein [Sphingomonas psychrotolerans]MDT8759842.1 YdeI/OmpD-associated family protein [Sphingomonas psychrotolerans]
MPRDTRVDTYIAGRAEFAQPILNWMRARVHAVCPDIEESIKWSMPAFSWKGKPLANMAAFKAHATFGFWDRQALATGKEGAAMGQYGRIESLDDLPDAATFEAQIRDAVARIDAGEKPKRGVKAPKPEAEVPPELAEALAGDPAAAATFTGFPPGCRREYCEWIAEAKRPETKAKRVAEAVGWLREGKRRNWKYENC